MVPQRLGYARLIEIAFTRAVKPKITLMVDS